jgi:hypothetical protein
MRRTAQLLAGFALLSACGDGPGATEIVARPQPSAAASLASSADKDLATLRAATASFHSIDQAKRAGYDTQFPAGCFTSGEGAMGFHWMNGTKVGTLKVAEPQLILYEPQQNGSMKLVGVEYILPGLPTDVPPVLFGRTLGYNTVFQVWALHVWVWENNPKGLYANWNPNVSCQFAATVSATSHH